MTDSISPTNPPYLTLTISQALSLPAPHSPEPSHHASVNAMLDFRARHMPDHLAVGFTYLPSSSSSGWQCHTLTYVQIRGLALSLAAKLRSHLPEKKSNARSPNKTPLVAVLSPSGLDLFAHIVALWRLGYGVLCIAPGSPAESIANLLRLTETDVVLAHGSQMKAARAAVEVVLNGEESSVKPRAFEMLPDVVDVLHSSTTTNEKQEEEYSSEAGPEDVLVTMHTSGSSGLPKPIYQLHRFWTTSMLSAPGRNLSAFTTTPLFHGGMSDMLRSIQAGSTIFFHPTADPGALSTAAICDAITCCPEKISYFLSVPYILDMLFTDRADSGRKMLSSMQLVSTGGAPLPQQLGNTMVQQDIKLVSRLGSSECGFLMSSWREFSNDKEWNQLRIPDQLGQSMIRFEPHDPTTPKGGLFELIVTKDWPTKLVANRDDGGYATSDLYCAHETLPNTRRYDSRADDTIVLVSGKKATAPLAEQKLKASSLVSEAIVFGANRAILGALVFVTPEAAGGEEKAFDDEVKVKILQELQPTLAEINAASPPHAQLATEMVHLLPPSEAANIPRASKGTLQRGRAYQHYATLIDSVYTDFEEGRSLRLPDPTSQTNTSASAASKDALSGKELVEWLQRKVEAMNGTHLPADKDVFVAGVDSIQSARIRAAIHQNIGLGGKLLDRNVVYEYPTLEKLAQHIEAVRSGEDDTAGGPRKGDDERTQRELKLMRELVEKYAAPQRPVREDRTKVNVNKSDTGARGGTLYILTGVTGGLGAQILDQVLSICQPNDSIICLVRSPTPEAARQRLLDSLSSRQLYKAHSLVKGFTDDNESGFGDGKVTCLPSNLDVLDIRKLVDVFGSYAFEKQGCRRVVTIHSAWSVNFVAGLSSFEAENIAGLAQLMDVHDKLTAQCGSNNGVDESATSSCFLFCSSVASVLAAETPSSGVSERLSTNPEDAVAMGYARSKWVAEQIVARRATATTKRGSRYSVVRIGQLCSDTKNGVWNESEAWPILIQISQLVGSFPNLNDGEERLDWLSTDIAARTVVDLTQPNSHSGKEGEVGAYNVAQPTTAQHGSATARWTDLYNWLTESGLKLDLIAPEEWLKRVEAAECDHRGLLSLWQKNFTSTTPAVKKEKKEEEVTRFVCDQALDQSPAFTAWQNQGVTKDLIQKTVQRWKEIGFLK